MSPGPYSQDDKSFLNGNRAITPNSGHHTNGDQGLHSESQGNGVKSESDVKGVMRRKLASWVGFSNLPNQFHRRSVK